MFMIIGGWAVASCALLGVLVGLGLHWNFMDWSPKWDGGAAFYGFSIAAILGCIWFLAKATRDRGSRAGSLLICLILAGVAGVLVLPAEPLTAGLMSRTMPSPSIFWGFVLTWFLRRRIISMMSSHDSSTQAVQHRRV